MNRLKYRRNHIVNGIENRAEKVVDSSPDGSEEIPDRCKYGRCHRLNGSDNGGEGIGNGCPGVDEKVPDSGNNSREKGSNAVPCVHKKCFDGSPDFVPACSEPPQHHICNAFQGIHNIAERVDNEVPDRCEDAFDAIPALFPVASEQTDQSIQQPQKNTSKLRKDVGDILKDAFKNGSQQIAQPVPRRFQHIGETLKVESQSI